MSSENEKIVEALTNVAEGKYEFATVEMQFEKREIEEIKELSKSVDVEKAGDEILEWLTKNVAHFIDNKEREFRIDLVIDEKSSEEMANVLVLQDLYRAVPDDSDYIDAEKAKELMEGNLNDALKDEDLNKLVECRETLDKVSSAIHDHMRKSDKLQDLYDAMIYYYEMIGINQGLPIVKSLSGSIDIVEFEYEAFNVAVNVLEGMMNIEQDVQEECEKEVIKQYVIPEGFSLLLEISFIDNSLSRGLF
jgi:hypothetical protein